VEDIRDGVMERSLVIFISEVTKMWDQISEFKVCTPNFLNGLVKSLLGVLGCQSDVINGDWNIMTSTLSFGYTSKLLSDSSLRVTQAEARVVLELLVPLSSRIASPYNDFRSLH